MAAINRTIEECLAQIMAAVYGEEVRGSIHDSIYMMNEIANWNFSNVNPSGTDYDIGTIWFNSQTGDVFRLDGTVSAKQWVLKANIKGNPGAPGEDGDTITNIQEVSYQGRDHTIRVFISNGDHYDFHVFDGVSGSGTGDMLKSTYDKNDSGVVDNSEALGGVAAAQYMKKSEYVGNSATGYVHRAEGIQTTSMIGGYNHGIFVKADGTLETTNVIPIINNEKPMLTEIFAPTNSGAVGGFYEGRLLVSAVDEPTWLDNSDVQDKVLIGNNNSAPEWKEQSAIVAGSAEVAESANGLATSAYDGTSIVYDEATHKLKSFYVIDKMPNDPTQPLKINNESQSPFVWTKTDFPFLRDNAIYGIPAMNPFNGVKITNMTYSDDVGFTLEFTPPSTADYVYVAITMEVI